jgi:very-short-patch-repair endonuclease
MKVALTKTARKLRTKTTDAENKLWLALRSRRMNGFKFKRQVPFGPYIADFLCAEAKLIVEADGSQHAEQASADDIRTAHFESQGYRVLRFWNNDVLQNLEGVLEAIAAELGTKTPSSCPSPQGEKRRQELPAHSGERVSPPAPSPPGERIGVRGSSA